MNPTIESLQVYNHPKWLKMRLLMEATKNPDPKSTILSLDSWIGLREHLNTGNHRFPPKIWRFFSCNFSLKNQSVDLRSGMIHHQSTAAFSTPHPSEGVDSHGQSAEIQGVRGVCWYVGKSWANLPCPAILFF